MKITKTYSCNFLFDFSLLASAQNFEVETFKMRCDQFHLFLWFYYDNINKIVYLACFDFLYQKLLLVDYSIHFEDLEDNCLFAHTLPFNDDDDDEYVEKNIFTNIV